MPIKNNIFLNFPPSKQSGVSLIEVMVSMFVLAIGMLGIAAILLVSLRNTQGSTEHSNAVIHSYSVLDTMRSNRPQAVIGGYNLTTWTCNPPSSDNRVGAELAVWINNIQQEVSPSACGMIVCSSQECNVSIRWDDERASGGSSDKVYNLRTRI